jgi:phenylpropionate dioxygenase-like ring-hydroxylating dioxygenase large terminal subunit
MLSREQNDMLVRVGPETPMGKLMRLYWVPFLRSEDLKADGAPYRVRLLGEDLVAFRDTEGRVGLVDHACPHRRAPMVFGRNEEGGLRCMYHGWKFDVSGQCREMPAEPNAERMCSRMRIMSYVVRERNGVLWTYMGPDQEHPPELPLVEWNLVAHEQVEVSLRVQECNWLQALEGEIDSAHAALLHGRVDAGGLINSWRQAQDLMPTFECVENEAGLSIAARRKTDDGRDYVRINQFMMPFWTLVPPQAQFPDITGHAWVPIDDENTLCFMFSYHPSEALAEKTVRIFREGYKGREAGHPTLNSFAEKPVTHPYHNFWSKFNPENGFLFDYSLTKQFNSGIPGLWVQDAASQCGVGPIADRTKEHLGTTDTGVVKVRRMLLDGTHRLLTDNATPASTKTPEAYLRRSASITIERGGDWKTLGSEFIKAKLGEGFGYVP